MFGKLFKKLKAPTKPSLPVCLQRDDLDAFFEKKDFYPRPAWAELTEYIESMSVEQQPQAWQDFAFHWLTRLAESLGPEYRVDWSQNFILMSPRSPQKAEILLQVVEHQRKRILDIVGNESYREGWGFYTLLLFESVKEYERYVSHFGPGGTEAGSGGMFFGNEYYGHIALFGGDARILEIVLAHELTHNLLWPSSLPLWLEEGICQSMEEITANAYRQPIGRQTARKHREFWTGYGIGRFWTGEAFACPEGQECAYELALVLVRVLAERTRNLAPFLESASWQDGGFSAAESLGFQMDEVVAGFLGEGEWGFKEPSL